MRFTQQQLKNTRKAAEGFEAKAARDTRALLRARKEMRATMQTLHTYQYLAAFHADENPKRAAAYVLHVPSLQRSLEWYATFTIPELEESRKVYLEGALASKALLDRYAVAAVPRRESGLWALLVLCWKGWRARRLQS